MAKMGEFYCVHCNTVNSVHVNDETVYLVNIKQKYKVNNVI